MKTTTNSGKAFKHSDKSKRNKGDFYATHHSIVWQLFQNGFKINKKYGIHDPASGEGDILEALKEIKINNVVSGKDLSYGDDYILENSNYDVIFTNPPFSIANDFLEKSFSVANKMIVFLLPLDYLHGSERYNKFYKKQSGFYLSEVHILVRRPMFEDKVRQGGVYHTGSITFAWFVWTKKKIKEPKIKWIDNNKYVIGSQYKTEDEENQLQMEFK